MLLFFQNVEAYARMGVDLLLKLLQGRDIETPVGVYRFKKAS